MKNTQNRARSFPVRKLWLTTLALGLFAFALSVTPSGSANHPVLVEGNCDSPVPGTTIVDKGTCGDFDGDGRIGTAEDTDGADRIFGTLAAAIGPGTGAAAGTGANQNGRVTIVKSGRFAEVVLITGANGNVEVEAAPGVDANIDAVFQGDPAGGNNVRQTTSGIIVDAPADRRITLRNLVIRNWTNGVEVRGDSRVVLFNCRIDNNQNTGIITMGNSRITVDHSQITATGYRVGTLGDAPRTVLPASGNGVEFQGASGGVIANTLITGSFGVGIARNSSGTVNTFHVVLSDNRLGSTSGGVAPAAFSISDDGDTATKGGAVKASRRQQ